jgi:hypothetical protein
LKKNRKKNPGQPGGYVEHYKMINQLAKNEQIGTDYKKVIPKFLIQFFVETFSNHLERRKKDNQPKQTIPNQWIHSGFSCKKYLVNGKTS